MKKLIGIFDTKTMTSEQIYRKIKKYFKKKKEIKNRLKNINR